MTSYLLKGSAGLLAAIPVLMLIGEEDLKGKDFGPPHGPPPPVMLFKVFDENTDDTLAKSEVPARIWDKLSAADANLDDGVSKDELKTFMITRIQGKFDANADKSLTQNEVPEKLWERLKEADANKDGGVTTEELMAFKPKFDAKAVPKAGLLAGPPPIDKVLQKLDTNGDDALTAAEVPAFIWDHLSEADADTDGKVTKTELFEMAVTRPFDDFDKNDDGELTQNELPSMIWQRISLADIDASGSVSSEEVRTALSVKLGIKPAD